MLQDAGRILQMIKKMADLETAISKLYEACAGTWEEDRDFWTGLSQMESRHCTHLIRIAEMLVSGPERFEAGRLFSPVAVDTAVSGIRSNLEKLKRGELKKLQMLYICRDIENSILESRYADILKTEDINYNTIISEIVSQTAEHRQLLLNKIASAKEGR